MSTSARIFINYRRSDSAGWARQLHGDLGRRFGVERVFRDVAIEPGVDFVERIEGVMDACEVCIAVIGRVGRTRRRPTADAASTSPSTWCASRSSGPSNVPTCR